MMCNMRAVFLLIKGYLEIIEFIEIHFAYRVSYIMVEGFHKLRIDNVIPN